MPVAFLIVPIFGFANAGVSFAGVTPAVLIEPLSLGVAGGLVLGKLIGVFGAAFLMVRTGLTVLPAAARPRRSPPSYVDAMVVTLRQPGEFAGFLTGVFAQNPTLMRVMLTKSALKSPVTATSLASSFMISILGVI